MSRVRFSTEIHAELSGAMDRLVDRFARFNFLPHEVHEMCLYSGITKTRVELERLEAIAAASRSTHAPALSGA